MDTQLKIEVFTNAAHIVSRWEGNIYLCYEPGLRHLNKNNIIIKKIFASQ